MQRAFQDLIINLAKKIGFDEVKFLAAKPLFQSEAKFLAWRSQGYAADMQYLLRSNPINARPEYLLNNAKTIIMLSANYYSPCPPKPSREHGRIAAYAVGLDYHKVLRNKIQELLNQEEMLEFKSRSKFFTDSVPLLEKSFASKAGLGFRGRNTLLISRENGSFNFIAEIITDIEIEANYEIQSNQITCGNCTRCLDSCPTQAFPQEYQLDSRKCISYHNIENRGLIPEDLARKFGDWFFGCDLCQIICPYNKKSSYPFPEFSPEKGFGHWFYLPEMLDLEFGKFASVSKLLSKLENHKYIHPDAFASIQKLCAKEKEISEELLDRIFQIKFARSSLLRPKRLGLIRNAKIVLENSSN